ncbi:MAG: hypothetical protein ACR2IE_05815 [Candidatus Sumerlaeaceae bacterium]
MKTHPVTTSFCIAAAAAVALAFGLGTNTNAQAAESTATVQAKGKAKKPSVKVVNNANCPVAGSPIGSMGEGSKVTYKGYQVSLCCGGCSAKFNAKPDEYLKIALADAKRK